jgi:hypothetical protein
MKTIPLSLAAFIFCSVLLAQLPGSTAQKPKQILFDFRLDRKISTPKITPATERSVLTKVFRRYLTDSSKCSSNFETGNETDPLKAARNVGQIVPSITDLATGSFTAPGQTQSLYVISVSECNASHADNFGTKRVAIFSGQQLLADMDADFRMNIIRKTDLNGDGVDELLMTTGDMNQGNLIEMASLVDFQRGKLHVIQDFGTVTDDSCASGIPGSTAKASLLSISPAGPGDMPKIHQDNYSSSCRNPKKWRFLSDGKMPGQ